VLVAGGGGLLLLKLRQPPSASGSKITINRNARMATSPQMHTGNECGRMAFRQMIHSGRVNRCNSLLGLRKWGEGGATL
jgi:hypothetical protein